MRVKHILCPVDFSDCSREAFLRAVELAKEASAPLRLIHVYQVPLYNGSLYVPEILTNLQKTAEENVGALVTEAGKLGASDVRGEAMMGVPWDEIVRHARDLSTDLIVMGTHGRTGLKHAFIGSVAERVVRHAPCAVMVVRPAAKPAA